jgi:hypothetical protein
VPWKVGAAALVAVGAVEPDRATLPPSQLVLTARRAMRKAVLFTQYER